MKVMLKHVKHSGFKGSDMYDDAKFHWHYYRACPLTNTFTIISNHSPQYVCQFQLTPEEMKAFKANRLGIVPPGCCSASGRKCIEREPDTIIRRDIKDIHDLRQVLEILGIPTGFTRKEIISKLKKLGWSVKKQLWFCPWRKRAFQGVSLREAASLEYILASESLS